MVRTTLAAVYVLTALWLAACGRSTPPSPTPTPTPVTPQGVLAQSGQVMASLASFHFRMVHEVGSTEMLPGLKVDDVFGDVQTPDRLLAEFRGLFGAFTIKAQIIAIGEENYMTNPLSGVWEKVDTQVTPIGFFNPREGIASMMGQITEAQFLDPLPTNSDVFRIGGVLEARALRPLLGNTLTTELVSVELHIEQTSLRLLRAVFEGAVTPTDQPDTLRLVTMSGFNEPVTIEPPQ
ncbi:MAG: LppX_LprAFG lipoprotein [SAR202 cluster bacterium]|nr:LppX_LprAFG lipoprotein [SAR202 cluster bacterium]